MGSLPAPLVSAAVSQRVRDRCMYVCGECGWRGAMRGSRRVGRSDMLARRGMCIVYNNPPTYILIHVVALPLLATWPFFCLGMGMDGHSHFGRRTPSLSLLASCLAAQSTGIPWYPDMLGLPILPEDVRHGKRKLSSRRSRWARFRAKVVCRSTQRSTILSDSHISTKP